MLCFSWGECFFYYYYHENNCFFRSGNFSGYYYILCCFYSSFYFASLYFSSIFSSSTYFFFYDDTLYLSTASFFPDFSGDLGFKLMLSCLLFDCSILYMDALWSDWVKFLKTCLYSRYYLHFLWMKITDDKNFSYSYPNWGY